MSGENVYSLIKELSEKKIQIWLEEDALKFKAPKGAMDAELKNRMVKGKQALIDFLKEQSAQKEIIQARPDSSSLPISNAQQRLWFIEEFSQANTNSAYNIPVALRLKGKLNIAAMQYAINTLVARHEVLQTCFSNNKGLPKQERVENPALELPIIDLRSLADEEEKQKQCQAIINANINHKFDLQQWPLFKAELIQTADEEFIFLSSMHHIISDGWSMGVLVKEVAGYYEHYCQQGEESFPAYSLQYADYAYWQSQQAELYEKQMKFWQDYLQDVPVLELPLDKKRNKYVEQSGAHQHFLIPASTQKQLNELANAQGVTPFMILVAAFNILLSRFSQQKDISVGIPVANRNRSEWENMIGFFVNTLVLRNDLSASPSFIDFLTQVQTNTLAIYSNQDLPFDSLVERMVNQRDSAYTPLFQVMFSLQNSPMNTHFQLTGVDVEVLAHEQASARYDMTWNLEQKENGIAIDLEYRSDLFSQETMMLYLEYYQYLLKSICENPSLSVDEYLLEEPKRTLEKTLSFNPEEVDYPRQELIFTLFEKIAHTYPDNIAISSSEKGNESVSYAELLENVNSLAKALHQQGVQENDRVLLAFPRSVNMIQALLAVLKLGACYVPVDVQYPVERKQYIQNDSGASILLSSKALETNLSAFDTKKTKTLFIEEVIKQGAALDITLPQVVDKHSHQRAACIFYTSGSTGEPKGVIVPHRAIVRLVHHTNFTEFNQSDVLGHISNVCFDASSLEIWGALLVGGRMHVVDQDTLLSTTGFAKVIKEQNISIMFLSMGLFRVFASESPGMFGGMLTLLIGGEAVDLNAAQAVLTSATPPACLMNGYGPTENATFTACYPIRKISEDMTSVPLGKAITHGKVFICNEKGELLPAGIPGELVCSGDGLAVAYLNKKELTQEKFREHFLTALPDERVYLTGDLARYSSDGTIILSGRIDEQVKLRGFRIEPGEIEHVLDSLNEVATACVAVKESPAKEKYLVAYLLLDTQHLNEKHIEAERALLQVKEQASATLPAYMRPTFYELLESVPINANGKLDKRALPEPDWSQLQQDDYVAPSNTFEEQLESMWCDLLGISPISVQANFFELGGHSLLATRLASRINAQFNIDLKVKEIFENPSIEALARLIQKDALNAQDTLPLVRVSRDEAQPLSKAQQRLWFMHQMNPESSAYGMPMAVSIEGKLDIEKLKDAVKALVERQESLRTRFVVENDVAKQLVIAVEGSFEFISKTCNSDDALQSAIAANQQRSFDLENGPLFFVELLQCSGNKFVLLMNMHHIISDGWSMKILQQELLALYQNQNTSLAPLSFQYIDFASWQNAYLTEEKTNELLNFWLDELKDVNQVLHLPTDKPRPEEQSFKGNVLYHSLNESTQKQALAFCKEYEISSFVLGISCYALLLSKYAQQNDFCIGIPLSGRNQSEMENVIGFFVNGVVLRSDLRQRLSVMQLLKQFRKKMLNVFSHQDLSADLLIEAMHIQPNPRYQPLAQVAFSHQSIDELPASEVEGARFEMLASENNSAKYDMIVSLSDMGDSLSLACEYATDLFEEESIASFMQNYEKLLSQLLASPEAQVDQLSLYNESDILAYINEKHDNDYSDVYPLSFNQQAIYLDALINPESKQNSIANFLDINHELDVALWQKAFEDIQQQHAIFRTRILDIDLPAHHQAYQCISKNALNAFEFHDLRDQKLNFETLVERVENEAYCTYDVTQDALYHYTLYQLDNSHFVGMLRAHHLIFDGVAGRVFLEEIAARYQALLSKQSFTSDVSETNPFKDYIRDNAEKVDTLACLDFWRQQTKEIAPLSFDTSDTQAYAYLQKNIIFDDVLSQSIRKFCRAQGITSAIFFKCLYASLINLYCRAENDFVLFEYAHGRNKANEQAYGVYYQQSPFVLKKDLFNSDDFETLFQALLLYAKDFQKQSRVWKDISVQSQRQLFPQGNIGFMYNYTQFEADIDLLGKKELSLFLSPRAEHFVQFFIREHQSHFECLLLFGNDYFNDHDFLERLRQLAQHLVSGSAQTSSAILLDQDLQLLEQVSQSDIVVDDKSQFLLEPFVLQAKQYPNAPALIDNRQTLTYQMLDERSSALASVLINEGKLKAAQPVALYLCFDANYLVALYAVLKAGASYVPVSTSLPLERVTQMLETAGVQHVLSDSKHASDINSLKLTTTLIDQVDINQANTLKLPALNEQQLIYTLFTSGSTGLPKGAQVLHKGENKLLQWYEQALAINENDCSIIISAPAFDLTQKNLFSFLRKGGRLVLPEQNIFDPEHIRQLISHHQVTHINCAPSAFYALLEGGENSWNLLSTLRWVVLGGEALVLSEMENWYRSSFCHAQIMNSYGPTECSDVVCIYILNDEDFNHPAKHLPIGRAIANTQLYVLDEQQQLLPAGLVGEIAIGGDCLGSGYVGDEALTQEKFIEIDTSSGLQKVYLSGDLGRVNADAQMEYIGRKDFQVKLRGQRIELGEIEFALREQQGIRDALVLVSEEKLLAYVVLELASDINDFDDENCLSALSKRLPVYMIPALVIPLQSWPLNANGKIDRKALPKADFSANKKPKVAPRNEREQMLADIWCDVLGISEVSVNDSFFELGGHSLLATKAVARIKEQSKLDFPLRALFDLHTIAGIAEYLDTLQWAIDSKQKAGAEEDKKDSSREEGFL